MRSSGQLTDRLIRILSLQYFQLLLSLLGELNYAFCLD
jgi:hypothetical protein